MTVDQIPTPENDKLSAASDERDTLVAFLDWLGEQQIALHRWHTDLVEEERCPGPDPLGPERCPGEGCPRCKGTHHISWPLTPRYLPVERSGDQIIMDFLGIDTNALETERRALLASLRQDRQNPEAADG